MIQSACNRINANIEAVGEVHLATPSPNRKPKFLPTPFDLPQSARPTLKKQGFLSRLFGSKRAAIERQNAETLLAYEATLADWELARSEYEAALAAPYKLIEEDIYVDPAAMEQHLGEVLAGIDWPRQTDVSFEISTAGRPSCLTWIFPKSNTCQPRRLPFRAAA